MTTLYLGNDNTDVLVDGSHTRILDFGGNDTYTLPRVLSSDVVLVDNQRSRIELPGGFEISEVKFVADGMRIKTNDNILTILGDVSNFSFFFGDNSIGTTLSFNETASLFGATIPVSGLPPEISTVSGIINSDGSIGQISENNPPIANDDSATVTEGESIVIDVLANDSDPDGDALMITSITQGDDGSVEMLNNGLELRYTPDPNFSGNDFFVYTVTDSNGDSATAQVSVAIEDVIPYPTIDYLPDLTQSEMSSAITLQFEPYTSPLDGYDPGWDNKAYYGTSEDYALLRDLFVWEATRGYEYDIFSHSYFDPFIIQVYDNLGNVVAVSREGSESYGTDVVWDFVAPYTGEYYVSASWNQGNYYEYCSISIYEDVDAINNLIG